LGEATVVNQALTTEPIIQQPAFDILCSRAVHWIIPALAKAFVLQVYTSRTWCLTTVNVGRFRQLSHTVNECPNAMLPNDGL